MVGNSVKVEKFVLDYFERINKNSDKNKNIHIYNILTNCYLNSESSILDKKMITLYFTDEQLDLLKIKQEELGYKNNFSRFVRYALFNDFMKNYDILITNEELLCEPIDCNKLDLLLDRCKNELVNGEYTSYDIDLLRNNKKYEGKILFDSFNDFTEEEPFNIDFLECDMLVFLQSNFEKGKLYSELIGLSTEQVASSFFTGTEYDKILEPFVNYNNIVPDTDNFYYLLVYYIFTELTEDFEDSIDEIFNETDEHIELLLKKYTFEKILKYYEQKHNITEIDKIFDKKCIESLKSDNIIELNEDIKPNEDTELDDIGT